MRAYWWSCIVKGAHCNFEASSFCNQDILFWYSHILEGDASGIRTSLTHVQLLQTKLTFIFDYTEKNIQLIINWKKKQAFCYLSSNLNSRSVSIHNEASKCFAGWTFRIRVSPSQEEVPTHRKMYQLCMKLKKKKVLKNIKIEKICILNGHRRCSI